MSGIAGIIHFDGAPVEPGLIEKMTSTMAHRGPDGVQHWVRGNVALGQRMLRTTPESLEETQPLTNEDESVVLVMDGRVDNWKELRGELLGRGIRLRTRADAELVLRSYESCGEECLSHIDGDFALVVWDARTRSAFCARDRLGNRTLNYHWDGKTLSFASEARALTGLSWIGEDPNHGLVSEFLSGQWASLHETFWRGVMKVPPACCTAVSRQGLRPSRYWAPDLALELPVRKEADVIEYYRTLFNDVVNRLSRSAWPVAYEVSGGLDSSAVFAAATLEWRAGRSAAPAVGGYTLAFADGSQADETAYARGVASHLGVEIHEVPPSRLALQDYRNAAQTRGEFPGYPNAMMFRGLRRRAREDGCRVVVTGEGGDEWLAGERTYYAEALAAGSLEQLWQSLRSDAAANGMRVALGSAVRHGALPLLPPPLRQLLTRAVATFRRDPVNLSELHWLADPVRRLLLHRQAETRRQAGAAVRRIGQRRLLEALGDAHSDHVMEHNERLSADVGLENRYPLRTRAILEFAFALPDRFRLRGGTDKLVHVRALSGRLPESVLSRRSKAEFSSVFREPLDSMKDMFENQIPSRRPDWVSSEGMKGLYRTYQDYPARGWPSWVLWSIFGCHVLLPEETGR